MSERAQSLAARLQAQVEGSFSAALCEELAAQIALDDEGERSVLRLYDELRAEVELLAGGLRAIADGADPRRVASDVLEEWAAMVAEGKVVAG